MTYQNKTRDAQEVIDILKKVPGVPKYSNDLLRQLNETRPDEEKISPIILRSIINWIRVTSMAPILSSQKGYYYSTEKEDIVQCIQNLKSRSKAILNAADGLRAFVIVESPLHSKINAPDEVIPYDSAVENRI